MKEDEKKPKTPLERGWGDRIAEELQREDVSGEHPGLFVKQFLSNF